jgi:hypothetical protein
VARGKEPGPAQLESAVSARPAPGTSKSPSESSVEALIFDLTRIVDAEEGSGWLIDEAALRNVHPGLMESVCRATPDVRERALARVTREGAESGDPRAEYAQAGGELTDRVEAAISASRRALALGVAITKAPVECPFWLRPDPEFRGLQSTRDRWMLNFDTGGTAQIRNSAGSWTLGAGGFGRLLLGYGFTHVSLLGGVEFGGGALLEPNTNPTQFAVNYIPALPFLVRLHRGAWHLDCEAAMVGLFQAGNTELSYGVRGGLTLGISSLRLRGVLPWVGLGVAAEYHLGTLITRRFPGFGAMGNATARRVRLRSDAAGQIPRSA